MGPRQAVQFLGIGVALLFVMNGVGVSGQEEAHNCVRRCDNSTEPMMCEYSFVVEWYLTLSKGCYNCPFVESDCYRPHCIPADGQRRALMTVNRQYPGPTLEVCEGDTVVVNVKNSLINGEGTTIHWHGVHQRGTPYADGTNMVTQCPISEQSTFTYEFDAYPSGTHFYHSHTGLQMADGLMGAFFIHSYVEDDPAYDLYDHDCDTPHGHCEQKVALHDWLPEPFLQRYLRLKHYFYDRTLPISSLINGKMKRYAVQNGTDPEHTATTPYTIYQLQTGKRYRFRLIGEGHLPCAYKVSVDGHNLLVIATDGRPVKPVFVDALVVYSGERYDFIINANHSSGGNFWLKAHTTNFCETVKANAYAIVRYEGAPEEDPPGNKDEDRGEGYLLQPILATDSPNDDPKYKHGEPYDITVDELDHARDENFTDEVVDETYYLRLSLRKNDNSRYHHPEYYPIDGVASHQRASTATIDNITFLIPPAPILSQPDDIDPSLICNRSNVDMEACSQDLCRCVHTLSYPQDKVVEIIMFNDWTAAHPMHMHGHAFRLIGMEYIGDTIGLEMLQERNEKGLLKKKLISPSYHDTVTVHGFSYVVIRLITDNPGYWVFHCHLTDHLDAGQIILLAIGERSALPPVPEGFPQCGDWSILSRRLKKDKEKKDCEKSCNEKKKKKKKSSAGSAGGSLWVFVLGCVMWILK